MDEPFFLRRPFLKDIAKAFQQVSKGKLDMLGVCLPTRAGKSYISSLWSAWDLGNNPDGTIMRNSCTAELALDFSYDIRGWVQSSEKYQKVFPELRLSQDKHKISNWALNKAVQTSYFCAGVGGTIVGKGCNRAAIIDDSIKNLLVICKKYTIIFLFCQVLFSILGTNTSVFDSIIAFIIEAVNFSILTLISLLANLRLLSFTITNR